LTDRSAPRSAFFNSANSSTQPGCHPESPRFSRLSQVVIPNPRGFGGVRDLLFPRPLRSNGDINRTRSLRVILAFFTARFSEPSVSPNTPPPIPKHISRPESPGTPRPAAHTAPPIA